MRGGRAERQQRHGMNFILREPDSIPDVSTMENDIKISVDLERSSCLLKQMNVSVNVPAPQ